jgi:iron-sulfur cluster repair protein YtfE (RIC family)
MRDDRTLEDPTVSEWRRDTIPEREFATYEHRELVRGIDRIHEVGMSIGTYDELSVAALEVLHWIDAVLEPHAEWEDRELYPQVDRRAGTPWATRLMSFEHQQIRDAAHGLATARARFHGDPSSVGALDLRARLFGLEAILRAHMAREERFLIPVLDGDVTPSVAAQTPH